MTAPVPDDAQRGHFERVGICGNKAPAISGKPPEVCDLPADHAGWHQAQQSGPSGIPMKPTNWTWTEPRTGADLIATERRRQVEAEGWTPEHDAEHADSGLALAAACYAVPHHMRKYRTVAPLFSSPAAVPTLWPWEGPAWKPTPDDRVRELVKAGALIAAEIDRLQARGDR